uniref:Uncharacterized protein n=1 Tax=Manihot esculenta TaxID=3983 RepID=A0A2C9VF63_MANES
MRPQKEYNLNVVLQVKAHLFDSCSLPLCCLLVARKAESSEATEHEQIREATRSQEVHAQEASKPELQPARVGTLTKPANPN